MPDLYKNSPAFYYKPEDRGNYCLAGLGQVAMYLVAMTNGGGGGHLNKSQWATKSFQNDLVKWQAIMSEAHPAIQRVSDTTIPEFWGMEPCILP